MAIFFKSRIDRGRNPLVLAIPRGAVPMGRVLADELNGELDVVLVRKLRSPASPEFAVGSIDETGWAYVAEHAARAGADHAYLEQEKHLHRGATQASQAVHPHTTANRREGTHCDCRG